MDEQAANKIYDVLVEVCGASEDERLPFTLNYVLTGKCKEWRFRGLLGFGGKFYDDGPQMPPRLPRFRVRCYPEDRTPEREEICKKADALLAEIAEEL